MRAFNSEFFLHPHDHLLSSVLHATTFEMTFNALKRFNSVAAVVLEDFERVAVGIDSII